MIFLIFMTIKEIELICLILEACKKIDRECNDKIKSTIKIKKLIDNEVDLTVFLEKDKNGR
jgi:hypothetical protein